MGFKKYGDVEKVEAVVKDIDSLRHFLKKDMKKKKMKEKKQKFLKNFKNF